MELVNKELVEILKKSKETVVKEMYPILEAADGEVIDGLHREEAGWQSRRRLPNVVTKLDKLVARALAHHRRTMGHSERRQLYDDIAEELIDMGLAQPEAHPNMPANLRDRPKVIPKIAELLCISEHSVALHISDKYKRGTIWKKEEPLHKAKTKRSIFEIRAGILEILNSEKEGVRPTPLMYKTNLSWAPLTKHLAFLYKKGFIDVKSSDKPRYFLTDPGRKVLHLFVELKDYLL